MTEPLPYEDATADVYAVKAAASFTVTHIAAGLRHLTGPCPRCGALIEIPVVDTVYKTRAGDGPIEAVVCTCAEPHPGRPEGHVGCGAYWNLILGPDAS